MQRVLVSFLVTAIGCGGAAPTPTPTSTSGEGSPTPPRVAPSAPVPCATWVLAEQLCACLARHTLQVDDWAGHEDPEDGGEARDEAESPPTCVDARDRLGFWREGADGYQTLWLVQREGPRARAATAPLVGQVQGKRHVSSITAGAITPRSVGAVHFVEVTYQFEDYEQEIAGIAETTTVDHVVRCQPTAARAGAEVTCPVRFVRRWTWSVNDERDGMVELEPEEIEDFRKQHGGYPMVERKASIRDEVRPSGEVVLEVRGPLPDALRPTANPWLQVGASR